MFIYYCFFVEILYEILGSHVDMIFWCAILPVTGCHGPKPGAIDGPPELRPMGNSSLAARRSSTYVSRSGDTVDIMKYRDIS